MNSYRTIRARTPAELETVYKLRQVAFANSDAEVLPGELLKDDFDGKANSISHLLLLDEVPIGTIRASIHSDAFEWQRIAAHDAYEAELLDAVGPGIAVAQSSHFAVLPQHRTRSWMPKVRLYKALVTTVAEHGVNSIVTIVRHRPTQIRFYSKLGFRPIASPRIHPAVNRMSVLLLTSRQEFSDWVDEQLG
jgi:hypothetical protein